MEKYYSNSVQIITSAFDLQLNFMLKDGFIVFKNQQEQKIEDYLGEPVAQVTLSLQQAKGLLNALSEQISKYEQTFGVINLQPIIEDPKQ